MNEQQKNYLVVMARWQNFLGILAAIGAGFIILCGLFFLIIGFFVGGEMAESFPLGDVGGYAVGILGLVYILLSLVYVFLARYQILAAKNLKLWAVSDNEECLTEGIKNTKSFFKFNGIMAIVAIALYIVIILVAMIVAIAKVI